MTGIPLDYTVYYTFPVNKRYLISKSGLENFVNQFTVLSK